MAHVVLDARDRARGVEPLSPVPYELDAYDMQIAEIAREALERNRQDQNARDARKEG